MHGLSVATAGCGRSLLGSPRPFSPAGLQRFEVRQLQPTIDPGISQRPFTLPDRLLVSEPPTQGQRSWPATSITSSAILPARSARHSPPSPGFPDKGGSQWVARCRPFRRTTLPAPNLDFPSGFSPLRIDILAGTGFGVCRNETPDLPSLPGCVCLATLQPAHRSRFASSRPAHCSKSEAKRS